jgi:hypothetical protein
MGGGMQVSHRFLAVGLVATLALSACSGDDDDSSNTTTIAPSTTAAATDGWDDAALTTAEELSRRIADGGLDCDDYVVTDYGVIAADYADKLPLPTAMSSCTGPGGEDFTFEVFADEIARDNFLATKQQLLCTEAAEREIDFPGFPYVEGSAWLIEPDEEGSANAIADLVDGESKMSTCPDAPTSTT